MQVNTVTEAHKHDIYSTAMSTAVAVTRSSAVTCLIQSKADSRRAQSWVYHISFRF